jgi:hypothetical protein
MPLNEPRKLDEKPKTSNGQLDQPSQQAFNFKMRAAGEQKETQPRQIAMYWSTSCHDSP